MTHANSPLSIEGRRRLVERCRTRPIAHVAAEMGISRSCAPKWVNRYRRYGATGLLDRPSTRTHKWSDARVALGCPKRKGERGGYVGGYVGASPRS
ncbi:leucine zipper domain-containing protein [Streptomyces coeruleorubidus]|nr:leucine zipper domain-containing protein [Streptomyces coeruleorubidus]WDV49646.1 leucine zipper domain-containing protein [Streptomyces coeruleorubidus]